MVPFASAPPEYGGAAARNVSVYRFIVSRLAGPPAFFVISSVRALPETKHSSRNVNVVFSDARPRSLPPFWQPQSQPHDSAASSHRAIPASGASTSESSGASLHSFRAPEPSSFSSWALPSSDPASAPRPAARGPQIPAGAGSAAPFAAGAAPPALPPRPRLARKPSSSSSGATPRGLAGASSSSSRLLPAPDAPPAGQRSGGSLRLQPQQPQPQPLLVVEDVEGDAGASQDATTASASARWMASPQSLVGSSAPGTGPAASGQRLEGGSTAASGGPDSRPRAASFRRQASIASQRRLSLQQQLQGLAGVTEFEGAIHGPAPGPARAWPAGPS